MIIANWNLDHGTELWRQAAIRSKLTDIKADVFILTETRESISPGEGFTCAARSFPSNDLKEGESWVEIWSRLPVLTPDLPTIDSEFTAAATLVLPDQTHLVVFGTVLPWRGSKWKSRQSAGALAFEAALGVQQRDWQTLAQSNALCVAGDFNQDLSDKPYYWSRRAKLLLQASLDEHGLLALTGDPTDPVRKLTNGAEACIDHICLSQDIAGRQVGTSHAWSPVVDGCVLSDHHGVWIELEDIQRRPSDQKECQANRVKPFERA